MGYLKPNQILYIAILEITRLESIRKSNKKEAAWYTKTNPAAGEARGWSGTNISIGVYICYINIFTIYDIFI